MRTAPSNELTQQHTVLDQLYVDCNSVAYYNRQKETEQWWREWGQSPPDFPGVGETLRECIFIF